MSSEDPDADSLWLLTAWGSGRRRWRSPCSSAQDRAEKRLAIGGADEQGRWYARDASRPQVFLVDSTLVQELTKGISDLRDKEPTAL